MLKMKVLKCNFGVMQAKIDDLSMHMLGYRETKYTILNILN